MFERIELTADGRLYGYYYNDEYPAVEINSFSDVLNNVLVIQEGTTLRTVLSIMVKETDLSEIIFEQPLHEMTIQELIDDMKIVDDEGDDGYEIKSIIVYSDISVYNKYLQKNFVADMEIRYKLNDNENRDFHRSFMNLTPIHKLLDVNVTINPVVNMRVYEINSEGFITNEKTTQRRKYHADMTLYEFYSCLLNYLTMSGDTKNKLKQMNMLSEIRMNIDSFMLDIIGLTVEEAIEQSELAGHDIMYVVIKNDDEVFDRPAISTEQIKSMDALIFLTLEDNKIVNFELNSYNEFNEDEYDNEDE